MIYGQWEKAGAKRFEERLREVTEEALKHEPSPLPPEVVKELDRMQAHWK
jgi:trimethylamine:corrinoid methyltransferase-like protein